MEWKFYQTFALDFFFVLCLSEQLLTHENFPIFSLKYSLKYILFSFTFLFSVYIDLFWSYFYMQMK